MKKAIKFGAILTGLVGAGIATGVIVKKVLDKRGPQVMYDDYDSDEWYDEDGSPADKIDPVEEFADGVCESTVEEVMEVVEEAEAEEIEE